ncbi:g2617 [Coccomyxa viridis]|uniref:G2617 protein n=1 Tax=Coccomyxa viridis TaxID=1274662 RepID=A0ABP1FPI2_9CHLO
MSDINITQRVYARIGLLGNPSDSYYGKTISLSLANFFAEVTLKACHAIRFAPHPLHDGGEYESWDGFRIRLDGEGYGGGVRLLKAMCKVFMHECEKKGVQLPEKYFELSYETNIPRQAGLSGSSAIACAALNCLLMYYDVGDRISVVERPGLVLWAEEELGITAGLQDRVVQVYGGVVYMDFTKKLMQQNGHGRYESLDPDVIPPLWLIYADNPSDSGRAHSDVRQRWHQGEKAVHQAMAEFATFAEKGRAALEAEDDLALASLMNRNFELRRRIFGDAALGQINLAMIKCAWSVNAAAKFTGSGGAIVALCPEGEPQELGLKAACEREGFVCVPVQVGPQLFKAAAEQ